MEATEAKVLQEVRIAVNDKRALIRELEMVLMRADMRLAELGDATTHPIRRSIYSAIKSAKRSV